ncbi:MAG: bifunctional riboflavin kinase/FAD synthetase [Bacteroidota bacterium]
MKVHEGIETFKKLHNAVVTSGTFDGVHFGHQKILNRVYEIAKVSGGESVVLTFWPHPRFIINPKDNFKLLNSFEEKAERIEKFGIDHLVKISFTRGFSEMSSLDFIKSILIEGLGTKHLVIGYDHRFGKNREGGFDYLKERQHSFGFKIEEIPKQDIDEISVSSTKIRNALNNGELELVSKYLTYNYSLSGIVVKGDQIGRTLGYPTANVKVLFAEKLIPGKGIYATKVFLKSKAYLSVTSIGMRPTFEGKDLRIEVHIFDFEQDIYGEEIKIEFVEYIRDEVKFDDITKLIEQMKKDDQKARTILNS